jgi:DNA-binding NtrC family response regulator
MSQEMDRILIADDNRIELIAISDNLKDYGFNTIEAFSGREAIAVFQKELPPLVLMDLQMPGMNGIEAMQEIKKINPDVPVIIITADGDIPTAVEAIKLGAYDFITKPPDFDRLALTLQRAAEKFELDKKVKMLRNEVEISLEYLLGKSEAMKKVIQQIHEISQSDFSLILQGETGTGKSFIARYIHHLSLRTGGPFVTVDIGSIPETLVESELFGYEKGAFTGASKKKKGFFETADRGTILIDELQNLSPYVQSKLLRAVEEKTITPLGSTNPVETNVRIIGATNKDIINSVKEEKSFREDLFYRLSEFMIYLPPLRERLEDIPFLAEKFIREAAEDLNKEVHAISDDVLSHLKNYSWPGNIRELKNVIRRAVLLAKEKVIGTDHIEFLIKDKNRSFQESRSISISDDPDNLPSLNLIELEKIAIKKALEKTSGNKTKAASLLNISYVTLYRKIKQHYNM